MKLLIIALLSLSTIPAFANICSEFFGGKRTNTTEVTSKESELETLSNKAPFNKYAVSNPRWVNAIITEGKNKLQIYIENGKLIVLSDGKEVLTLKDKKTVIKTEDMGWGPQVTAEVTMSPEVTVRFIAVIGRPDQLFMMVKEQGNDQAIMALIAMRD